MGILTDGSGARAAPRRRFRLLDAMILVAATALGCALVQWTSRVHGSAFSWRSICEGSQGLLGQFPRKDWVTFAAEVAQLGIMTSVATMPLVATLALLPIRVIGPRPSLRRLARQPGMMATCAVGVTIAFVGLFLVAAAPGAQTGVFTVPDKSAVVAMLFLPMFAGCALLVSWITLLVSRRWRAEPSWVDRLGRSTGVFWIVAGFAVTSLFIFDPDGMSWSIFFAPFDPSPAVDAAGETAKPLAVSPES
jgi:hypothetical protein